MSLLRSITTIGGYTIGSRIFGFLREVLTASFLGAGAVADALVVAIKLPSFFRRIFAEGAFSASFVPIFAGLYATEGPREAKTFAEQVLAILVLSLSLLTLVVELFMGDLLAFLLPGFAETPERLQLTIQFSRVTFPFLLFISLTALYGGVLNSLDRFVAFASSPMIGNIFIVGFVFAFQSLVFQSGYLFSLAILGCGVVQWLWMVWPAKQAGMNLRLFWPRKTPNIRRFFKALGPAAFGSGIVQINLFIGSYIASWLPVGSIAYINYADRLNQLPLSVIGVAVSTALLPLLSRQIRQGNFEQAQDSQNLALEFSLFLTLPAALALVFLAHPLIVVLFQHGKFGPADSAETAMTLAAFAIGLPAYVMIKVFSTSFFARSDTSTPLKTAALGIIIDIVLSVLLMKSFKHVGIAFATAVSAWVNALTLGFLLKRQGLFYLDHRLKVFAKRILMACFLTVLVLELLLYLVHNMWDGAFILQIVVVVLLVGGGLASYLFLAKVLKAVDYQEMKKHLRV